MAVTPIRDRTTGDAFRLPPSNAGESHRPGARRFGHVHVNRPGRFRPRPGLSASLWLVVQCRRWLPRPQSRVRAVGRVSPPSRCARGEQSIAGRIGFDAYPSQRWWTWRSFSRSWRCRMASIGRATNDVSVDAASDELVAGPALRDDTRSRAMGSARCRPCASGGSSHWLLQVGGAHQQRRVWRACRGPLPRSGMVHHHHQQRRQALRHLRLPEDPVTSRRQGKNDTPCGSASGAKPVSFCRRARDRLVRCTSGGQSVRLCCAA